MVRTACTLEQVTVCAVQGKPTAAASTGAEEVSESGGEGLRAVQELWEMARSRHGWHG